MRTISVITLAFLLTSCSQIAVMTTPKKHAIASHSPLAQTAEEQFWNTLHSGNYAGINQTEKLLIAAYLQNPNDPKLAAHLGFLNIWQLAERNRLAEPNPAIVNHIVLAKKYFSDAVALDSSDARYLGFLGDSTLIQGKIFADQREQVKGYFILKRAIRSWPQFNYFTAGYPMSSLASDTTQFKQGLDWQWRNLDVCTGTNVNRKNPDFRPYLKLETQQGPQRVCWNSWIAPYNYEGFFLNMGDMLVKAGDWQTAIIIYKNAELAHNYTSWPYKKVLQQRIAHAKENVPIFNKPTELSEKVQDDKTMMFNSSFSCMACHQQR